GARCTTLSGGVSRSAGVAVARRGGIAVGQGGGSRGWSLLNLWRLFFGLIFWSFDNGGGTGEAARPPLVKIGKFNEIRDVIGDVTGSAGKFGLERIDALSVVLVGHGEPFQVLLHVAIDHRVGMGFCEF